DSGSTSFTFTVSLSATSPQNITIEYAISDGTASSSSDYTSTSGTLTIPSGYTTGTFAVAVSGDTTVEPNENFTLSLTNPSHGTVTTGTGVGTIQNDDGALSIGNVA